MTKGWRLLRRRGGILDYCLSIGSVREEERERWRDGGEGEVVRWWVGGCVCVCVRERERERACEYVFGGGCRHLAEILLG